MGWIVDIVDQDVVQQHADRSVSSFPSQIIKVNISIQVRKFKLSGLGMMKETVVAVWYKIVVLNLSLKRWLHCSLV